MHPRLFRLIEKHQRIDDLLRLAQQRADGSDIHRLRILKMKAKHLIARFMAARAFAAASPAG
ncbi:DUF465 domain-containing protein [Sphingomonas sp.]|uniref:DUF465 domain-containing protein n=1 Tax=Sphingomonas sp. TaxID=28214 RepID=UPI0031D5E18C